LNSLEYTLAYFWFPASVLYGATVVSLTFTVSFYGVFFQTLPSLKSLPDLAL